MSRNIFEYQNKVIDLINIPNWLGERSRLAVRHLSSFERVCVMRSLVVVIIAYILTFVFYSYSFVLLILIPFYIHVINILVYSVIFLISLFFASISFFMLYPYSSFASPFAMLYPCSSLITWWVMYFVTVIGARYSLFLHSKRLVSTRSTQL